MLTGINGLPYAVGISLIRRLVMGFLGYALVVARVVRNVLSLVCGPGRNGRAWWSCRLVAVS